jgi:hypothetical protein
LPHEF